MNSKQIVGYTNNDVPLCLLCVNRFDLTNPAERDPEDVFLPITLGDLVEHPLVRCGSPVCGVVIGGGL